MVSHIGREREIDEDETVLESTGMSSTKVGDPRKAASCAGVGHGGEQGRERGGEEGHGICAKRDQMKGVWMLCRKAKACVILENGLQILWA